MILYKLTDALSRSGLGYCATQTQWGPGVTHETSGKGGLCGPGWLHAYEHPLLAALLWPMHVSGYDGLVLWECEGKGRIRRDGQLKCGVTQLTTVRQIPMPVVTREQRVKFAILCAKKVCTDKSWNAWADQWLSGEDRSREAAAEVFTTTSGAACEATRAVYAKDDAEAEKWVAVTADWVALSARSSMYSELSTSVDTAELDFTAIAIEAYDVNR